MKPYDIIQSRRVTEKGVVLESLHKKENNPSLARCKEPKVVFNVDILANKAEIAAAVEEIYKDQNVKVLKVNTSILKPKKRRVRGHAGKTARQKKAIVTLRAGDSIGTTV